MQVSTDSDTSRASTESDERSGSEEEEDEGGKSRRRIWSGHASKKVRIPGEETVVPGVRLQAHGFGWEATPLGFTMRPGFDAGSADVHGRDLDAQRRAKVDAHVCFLNQKYRDYVPAYAQKLSKREVKELVQKRCA